MQQPQHSDGVSFTALTNTGDVRGFTFTIPEQAMAFVGPASDVRAMSLSPGRLRGNHYREHRQVLMVVHRDQWTFHWDTGANMPVQKKKFAGEGAVVVLIESQCSVAMYNSGAKDLLLVIVSATRFDPAHPDAVRRDVYP